MDINPRAVPSGNSSGPQTRDDNHNHNRKPVIVMFGAADHASTESRVARYINAKSRDDRTGSPAARAELRDASLDLQAHGEMTTGDLNPDVWALAHAEPTPGDFYAQVV